MGTSIVNVALSAVRQGVGLTDSGMSWVVNAYGLALLDEPVEALTEGYRTAFLLSAATVTAALLTPLPARRAARQAPAPGPVPAPQIPLPAQSIPR